MIVIDDFDGTQRFLASQHEPIDWHKGIKPFIFSRNANIGIAAAGSDDVILLNDDAMLRTSAGFNAMQQAAEEHPEFGIIASSTNVTGYIVQHPHGIGLREASIVAFVCVLIPRKTLDLIGTLDERFTGYGWDDVDYCRRVRNAGLKVGVFDGCYVDHGTLTSTFRGAAPGNSAPGDIAPGRKIYAAKWGDVDAFST